MPALCAHTSSMQGRCAQFQYEKIELTKRVNVWK